MIIDVNAHLGHYPFRQLRHNTPQGLLALMDRHGINKAVVSSLNAVFYRDAHRGNEELADWVAQAPDRLIPLATINPVYPGWERDLQQALTDWKMKGVRLIPQYHGYSLNDQNGQAVLAAAAQYQVPIALHQRLEDRRQRHHFDLAADLSLEEVIAAVRPHPSLRVMLLNWLGIDGAALAEAGLKGRVLIDLTRIPALLQKQLPALIETLGIEAIAFGTHIPFNYPAPSLLKLSLLNLSVAEKECLAWRNAAAFLQMDERTVG